MTSIKKQSIENPSTIWAEIFVDELSKGGLTAVCIAPGSRSTPLTMAFFANKNIRVFKHLDERSAAFFALGIALAEKKPVALLCTSGTAAANFHPAIIEAQMSQVPLLILTADRPHELRNSGANQTIDQVKMFGDHVLWSVDIALPEPNAPDLALRNLCALAARTLARCNGFTKGPVHLNFPFRKPLQPADGSGWPRNPVTEQAHKLITKIEQGIIQSTSEQINFLSELINTHSRGLIVCGPRCPGGNFPDALSQMANTSGYPILADPLSGIRFGTAVEDTSVIGSYETFMQGNHQEIQNPDLILRFGSVPTSKWLNRYLNNPHLHYHIHIQESGKWADENHSTTHLLQVDPTELCYQLAQATGHPSKSDWLQKWEKFESRSWNVINDQLSSTFSDASVASALLNQIPPGSSLYVGNSLAIRHVDQFCQPKDTPLDLYANRGASGIDGNISTGLGIAAATNKLAVLLVGDITFYHDSNGLLALKQYEFGKVIIVLLNNNGGGIFRRLPISQFEQPFEDLFLTPHALDFAPIAGMYGLKHDVVEDLPTFRSRFTQALSETVPSLIEVRTDGAKDDQFRRHIISQVKSQLG